MKAFVFCRHFPSEIWGHFEFTFCRYLKSKYEGIYLLQVLPAKSICWCHLISMKKLPFDYDLFCPLKMMAFMIIKGNTFSCLNLKALPSINTFYCFMREITVYFSDEVFSLRFRGYFKQQCNIWMAPCK